MIFAVDVYYTGTRAKAAGALFNWQDSLPTVLITDVIEPVEEYVPGAFYKRELPCIMRLLEKVNINEISAIIIDGYVYTNNDHKPGLGLHLWETLDRKVPVIGVAKTSFHRTEQVTARVVRGKNSTSPLFISAIGMNLNDAAELIKGMPGEARIPDMLRLVDKATRKDVML